MRKIILLALSMQTIIPFCSSQNPPSSQDNWGWDKRLSFIVGAGSSVIATKLYTNPTINKTNENVTIERLGFLKPNVTLGILFTPNVGNIYRKVVTEVNGHDTVSRILVEHYPVGFSTALFINPVSLLIGNSGISNNMDLGIGFGYRTGDFSVLGTLEFFSIRQPQAYFIKQFNGNDQQYIINGEVQNSIDPNDNSIFRNKIAVSFGFKLCYTFDIVKSYYTNSSKITPTPVQNPQPATSPTGTQTPAQNPQPAIAPTGTQTPAQNPQPAIAPTGTQTPAQNPQPATAPTGTQTPVQSPPPPLK